MLLKLTTHLYVDQLKPYRIQVSYTRDVLSLRQGFLTISWIRDTFAVRNYIAQLKSFL